MRFLMRHERPPQEAIAEFAAQIGQDELIAELLLQRGIDTFEKAQDFFSSDKLLNPFLFERMEETVALIEEMIEAAFGKNFNDPGFWDFCKKNGIEYSSSTWSS